MVRTALTALAAAAMGLAVTAHAEQDPFSDEDWLNFDPEAAHAAINGGELEFLANPPERPVHHHHNTLVIRPKSLRDGWMSLRQCHENLDPFPRAQVLYHRERVRNLRITVARSIGEAWVEDNSVQLRDVARGARLCVEAESRALTVNEDGTFTVRSGPFMRKFLDGYFPMQVSMNVVLPEQLQFLSITPSQQRGFDVSYNDDGVHVNAWFEGRLRTEIVLARRDGHQP